MRLLFVAAAAVPFVISTYLFVGVVGVVVVIAVVVVVVITIVSCHRH